MGHSVPTVPDLPTLDEGVYRLETSDRTAGPLHSLVLDHLLVGGGTACWVDAGGHAQTGALARLAPTRRFLDRVRVARGFTAFQHYSLVDGLADQLTDETALVVVPALDRCYRTGDLGRGEPGRLLAGVADRLADLAVTHELPVLVTLDRADELARPVSDIVDHELACEQTQFGPRFVGDGFETLVYDDGRGVQTTLAFWERVVQARYDAASATAASEVTARGAN